MSKKIDVLSLKGEKVKDIKLEDNIFNIEPNDAVVKDANSYSKLTFVIGGSYGLSCQVKKRSNYLLSFSKMTFPHQLMRLILLEQVYRCMMINNNHKYHK